MCDMFIDFLDQYIDISKNFKSFQSKLNEEPQIMNQANLYLKENLHYDLFQNYNDCISFTTKVWNKLLYITFDKLDFDNLNNLFTKAYNDKNKQIINELKIKINTQEIENEILKTELEKFILIKDAKDKIQTIISLGLKKNKEKIFSLNNKLNNSFTSTVSGLRKKNNNLQTKNILEKSIQKKPSSQSMNKNLKIKQDSQFISLINKEYFSPLENRVKYNTSLSPTNLKCYDSLTNTYNVNKTIDHFINSIDNILKKKINPNDYNILTYPSLSNCNLQKFENKSPEKNYVSNSPDINLMKYDYVSKISYNERSPRLNNLDIINPPEVVSNSQSSGVIKTKDNKLPDNYNFEIFKNLVANNIGKVNVIKDSPIKIYTKTENSFIENLTNKKNSENKNLSSEENKLKKSLSSSKLHTFNDLNSRTEKEFTLNTDNNDHYNSYLENKKITFNNIQNSDNSKKELNSKNNSSNILEISKSSEKNFTKKNTNKTTNKPSERNNSEDLNKSSSNSFHVYNNNKKYDSKSKVGHEIKRLNKLLDDFSSTQYLIDRTSKEKKRNNKNSEDLKNKNNKIINNININNKIDLFMQENSDVLDKKLIDRRLEQIKQQSKLINQNNSNKNHEYTNLFEKMKLKSKI